MENRIVQSFVVYDPGQDAKIPLLRVPDDHVYTIEDAYISTDRTLAGSTADWFYGILLNGGTAQTATTAISGTAGSTAGWTANTPVQSAIVSGSGDLTANQWLVFSYQETGTVAPGVIVVTVEYVDGIGSKA